MKIYTWRLLYREGFFVSPGFGLIFLAVMRH